ncbi:uncharacterized protein [Salminus brasiliensis]|uniref:uncharacterized protein n=1 Tax=Salminus brasiliensis TaxID=930266 RepID=UPI003B831DC9
MALGSRHTEYISRIKQEYEKLMEEAASLERCHEDPQMLIPDVCRSSVKAGGHYDQYQFKNTCVLDSLLVALYYCYIRNELIQQLFRCDRTINAVMTFLCTGQHNQAKALWLIQLNLLSDSCRFNMVDEVDVWSEVGDHLPMFNGLVCANYHFDEDRLSPQITDELHQSTISAFQCLGDVKLLGLNYGDPSCAVVNVDGRKDTAPPLCVTDKYNRIFELQFLLLCKKNESVNHMVGCFQLEGRWYLYDNNPEKPPFVVFPIEHADFTNEYVIYLAGYVNITKHEWKEVPFGVPEEGSSVPGTRPFNSPIWSSAASMPVMSLQAVV